MLKRYHLGREGHGQAYAMRRTMTGAGRERSLDGGLLVASGLDQCWRLDARHDDLAGDLSFGLQRSVLSRSADDDAEDERAGYEQRPCLAEAESRGRRAARAPRVGISADLPTKGRDSSHRNLQYLRSVQIEMRYMITCYSVTLPSAPITATNTWRRLRDNWGKAESYRSPYRVVAP